MTLLHHHAGNVAFLNWVIDLRKTLVLSTYYFKEISAKYKQSFSLKHSDQDFAVGLVVRTSLWTFTPHMGD